MEKPLGCEAVTALDTLVGKWKAGILYHLLNSGKMRFGELKSLLPDITQKMLTSQLRELEEQDIVERIVYPQVPPKVEYVVTEHGRTLIPVLNIMNQWGIMHLEYMQNKKMELSRNQ